MSDIYGHFEEVWNSDDDDMLALTTLHGDRMTREKLHSKQAIAAELAWRDHRNSIQKIQIERLKQGSAYWKANHLAGKAEIKRLKASKWISVDDRLPDIPRGHESSGVVLVIADDDCQSLCTFYEDGSFCDEYQEEFTNVTHWQPLPEPPKV